MEWEKLMGKIDKLFELSESPDENEAKAAMTVAHELLAKHKLKTRDAKGANKGSIKAIEKNTAIPYGGRKGCWKTAVNKNTPRMQIAEEKEMKEKTGTMTYEEFKEVIVSGLISRLPDEFSGHEVCVGTVRKTNEVKEAVSVIPAGAHMEAAPVVYLDDAYGDYQKGKGIEEILTGMAIGIALPKPFKERFSLGLLRKEKIVLNLINREMNEEMLEGMPHADFLDLAAIYRVIVSSDERGTSTIPITRALMKAKGWTQEEIHGAARENTMKLYPLAVAKLNQRLYVVSNDCRIFGASVIFFEETVAEMKKRIGGSFYVMPSSVHEAMVVPAKDTDPSGLRLILKRANELYVKKKEWLSDNIYLYDAEENEISIYGGGTENGEEKERAKKLDASP